LLTLVSNLVRLLGLLSSLPTLFSPPLSTHRLACSAKENR
jgi:hypothetical protein